MLTLVSASVAFAVLAGVVAAQANATTYNAYHTLVDEGSVSVDAALRARAAVLDHMGDSATYLATTGAAQQTARADAQARWDEFSEQTRISWRNRTDAAQGEYAVYDAADLAASDYLQQIGAMYAFYGGDPPPHARAGQEFLAARETLNRRLVPALTGLEAVKVEDMAATYAGASQRITNWRWAVIGATALLALILLAGLAAVRRMHYRWSWPIGLALLATLALGGWMQFELQQASGDANTLVSDAYQSVAGVQDLSALASQGRALESIAIFDPLSSTVHLASFDQYNYLVEQTLCGPVGCTAQTFLSGPDTIAPAVKEAAVNEQGRLGLPRTPLIANVHFAGQADQFEALRVAYRRWLDLHGQLATQLTSRQTAAASALSTGESAAAFAGVRSAADAVRDTGRRAFDAIWQRVYFTSQLDQALALLFPLAGLLAAWGLWRRRSELFV
jgi:hypothetical protein